MLSVFNLLPHYPTDPLARLYDPDAPFLPVLTAFRINAQHGKFPKWHFSSKYATGQTIMNLTVFVSVYNLLNRGYTLQYICMEWGQGREREKKIMTIIYHIICIIQTIFALSSL